MIYMFYAKYNILYCIYIDYLVSIVPNIDDKQAIY